jgi:hypothetical protein
MALKKWLDKKIEKVELELKFLKALSIMLTHVENANVYTDSEDSSDSDDDDSIQTGDIQLVDEDDD